MYFNKNKRHTATNELMKKKPFRFDYCVQTRSCMCVYLNRITKRVAPTDNVM